MDDRDCSSVLTVHCYSTIPIWKNEIHILKTTSSWRTTTNSHDFDRVFVKLMIRVWSLYRSVTCHSLWTPELVYGWVRLNDFDILCDSTSWRERSSCVISKNRIIGLISPWPLIIVWIFLDYCIYRIPTVKLKISEKIFLKSGWRTSVTFKL